MAERGSGKGFPGSSSSSLSGFSASSSPGSLCSGLSSHGPTAERPEGADLRPPVVRGAAAYPVGGRGPQYTQWEWPLARQCS
eukprot:6102892-Prymnesium_polylepis.1